MQGIFRERIPNPKGSRIPENLGIFRMPNPKSSRIPKDPGTFRIPNPENQRIPRNPHSCPFPRTKSRIFPIQSHPKSRMGFHPGLTFPIKTLSLKIPLEKERKSWNFLIFFFFHGFINLFFLAGTNHSCGIRAGKSLSLPQTEPILPFPTHFPPEFRGF